MPLICFIELDKTEGVTVSVADDQGKITQTITMNGESTVIEIVTEEATSRVEQRDASILSKVKKGSDETEVLQTPTDVKVTCKNFTVDAETVAVSSKKDTKHTAKGKMTLTAQKDLAMATKAAASLDASRNVEVSAGASLTAKGRQKATIEAATVEVKGKTKTVVSSGAALSVEGAKIDIKGKAMLEAAAPITNLGKSMTTVKGQLVKLEAMMLKIG